VIGRVTRGEGKKFHRRRRYGLLSAPDPSRFSARVDGRLAQQLPAEFEQGPAGRVLVADLRDRRVVRVTVRGGPADEGAGARVEYGPHGGGVLVLLGDVEAQDPGLGR